MAEKLGRYEILEEIGQGGFATVYRARDTQLDRLVALKELKPVLLQDTDWVKRFRREARTIARLDHPRIVTIYDVHETENRLYIVMRLVNGPSLEDILSNQGCFPWSETLEVITTIAEGLDYAHAQGIVHRDLKPANILLDPERGSMLSDFGLAKLAGESSMSITAGGGFVGTPHYIAPEVWEGQGTTQQSDIYALGCILFEILTGQKLFKGETPPAVMMAHFKSPNLPQAWPDDVPSGIEKILNKALAKRQVDRYTTAGELAEALISLVKSEQPPQTVTIIPDVPDQVEPHEPSEQAEPDAPQPAVPSAETVIPISDDASESLELSITPGLSGKWRGFLAHLGPYVIVISFLAFINLLTSSYPWFIWPALGWGTALAFHLHGILLSELKVSGKWHSFWGHFGSYAIINGLLLAIYLMTDPGGYPWFLWPAGAWGAAVALHLWGVVFGAEGRRTERMERLESRIERRVAKVQRRAERRVASLRQRTQQQPVAPHSAKISVVNATIQAHLDKARTYKEKIEALIAVTSDQNTHVRLKELSNQVNEWSQAIEDLAQHIDKFQQNSVISHDLESVPRAIEKLEAQLATETDPATKTELERTLSSRRNQLAILEQLQNTMRRAEIKIESTLSALGTIYSQILASQSTDHVADYGRLSEEVDEEVRTLQDHLEALEEVKLGHL